MRFDFSMLSISHEIIFLCILLYLHVCCLSCTYVKLECSIIMYKYVVICTRTYERTRKHKQTHAHTLTCACECAYVHVYFHPRWKKFPQFVAENSRKRKTRHQQNINTWRWGRDRGRGFTYIHIMNICVKRCFWGLRAEIVRLARIVCTHTPQFVLRTRVDIFYMGYRF